MNSLCQEAVFRSLSIKKRSQLKRHIPELRSVRVQELSRDVEIFNHGEDTVYIHTIIGLRHGIYDQYVLTTEEGKTKMKAESSSREEPVIRTLEYSVPEILEMYILNRLNRKGIIIQNFEVKNEDADKVIRSMHHLAIIRTYHVLFKPTEPIDFLSNFIGLKTLKFSSTFHLTKEIIALLLNLNLKQLFLTAHGIDDSIRLLPFPTMFITNTVTDQYELFWSVAKVFKTGSLKSGYYKCIVQNLHMDDFFDRLLVEFPDTLRREHFTIDWHIPKSCFSDDYMCVPISESKALEVSYYDRIYICAEVINIPFEMSWNSIGYTVTRPPSRSAN